MHDTGRLSVNVDFLQLFFLELRVVTGRTHGQRDDRVQSVAVPPRRAVPL